MTETITLDTRKCESTVGNARIAPLRRGERGNVPLVVFVRRNLRPYDLTDMTAHLVWKAADGKLVGPVPMEVTDPATGTVRCTLPDACYSTVGTARAYVELRRGAELVDTTDELGVKVLDCIDADGEQADEYKPLIAEVREATDAAIKAAADATAAAGKAIDAAGKANEATVAATNAATKANEVEAKLTGNILKGKANDTFIHVEDAFPSTLLGIEIEGACKQDGTPSPDNTVPIQVIENPVVKVTGADTSTVNTSLAFTLPSEHPYLAKLPDGTADEIVVDEEGNVELVANVQKIDLSNLSAPNDVSPLSNGLSRYSYWSGLVKPAKNDSPCITPNFESIVDFYFYKQGCYASVKNFLVGAATDPTDTLKASGYAYSTLKIPEHYSLGKIEMPKAQDSIINVWTDAEVTPNTGIEYVRDVNIVVANIESAIASITQG